MPYETFFNLPDEKRNRLLEVLLDEFADNDYKNVSVGRIVDRVGIAKGSFYQYFADKQDCYLYLIQLGMEEKTAFLRQLPPDGTTDLFGRLRWMLNAGMRFQFKSPRLAKISYKAIFDDVPLPEETMRAIRNGGYAYFQQQVVVEIESGRIDPVTDPDTAAFMLNAVFVDLGRYLMERYAISPEQLLREPSQAFEQDEIHRTIEQVISILEDGLRKKGR